MLIKEANIARFAPSAIATSIRQSIRRVEAVQSLPLWDASTAIGIVNWIAEKAGLFPTFPDVGGGRFILLDSLRAE